MAVYMRPSEATLTRVRAEFQRIKSLPIDEGRYSEAEKHASKNRNFDIIPFNETRVRLPEIDSYINASYCLSKHVILCQAPLKHTQADFYDMLWANNCSAVVMLTAFEEKGKEKSYRYLPEPKAQKKAGNYVVTRELDESRKDLHKLGIVVSTLLLKKADQTKIVAHYYYPLWEDHKIAPVNAVAALGKVVFEEIGKKGMPVVHCSGGVGRAGTIASVVDAWEKMKGQGAISSIENVVAALRTERAHCVGNTDQYLLVYQTLEHLMNQAKMAQEMEKLAGPLYEPWSKLENICRQLPTNSSLLSTMDLDCLFPLSVLDEQEIASRPSFHLDKLRAAGAEEAVGQRAVTRSIVEVGLVALIEAIKCGDHSNAAALLELLEKLPLDPSDRPENKKNTIHFLHQKMYNLQRSAHQQNSKYIDPDRPEFAGDFGRRAFLQPLPYGVEVEMQLQAIRQVLNSLKAAWKL